MRPNIDDYFLGFARQASTRATCLRKKVGAAIVRDGILLSTGYNGSIRGMPHCTDPSVGCLMEDGHCCRTVHAESNAILQAAKNGVRIDGATLYSTASPCWPCFGLIANSGIRRVVFGEAYRAEDPGPKRVVEVAQAVGIDLALSASSTTIEAAKRQLDEAAEARRRHNEDPTTRHARPISVHEQATIYPRDGHTVMVEHPAMKLVREATKSDALKTDVADTYRHTHGVRVDEKDLTIGYCQPSVQMLSFLNGTPWNNMALNFVLGLRPSLIRVTRGEIKTDGRAWRVTVWLKNDDRTIDTIDQEVLAGGIGDLCGADLQAYEDASRRRTP